MPKGESASGKSKSKKSKKKSDDTPPQKGGMKYIKSAPDYTECGGKQSYDANRQGLLYCTNQECPLYLLG
jgi:hypothetical protein